MIYIVLFICLILNASGDDFHSFLNHKLIKFIDFDNSSIEVVNDNSRLNDFI
jgi:hypothetical protein